MFCSECGQPLEEGKAFCKACGTPVASSMPPPAPEQPAAPPPQAGPYGAPYVQPAAYQQPPGYAQRPGKTGKGGLIAGIVAAVVIVLAGAGVGVYFGVLRDGSGDEGGVAASTTSRATSTTTSTVAGSSSTTLTGITATTVNSGSTYQTIPGISTTTTTPFVSSTTTAGGGGPTAYLALTDEIVTELEADDARIPELATKINATAPKVPQDVRNELQRMLDRLVGYSDKLWAGGSPRGFEESFQWLDEAMQYMSSRITATIGGIEIMWSTGKVSSANDFFDQGRADRDAYRKAMAKYYESLPIE